MSQISTTSASKAPAGGGAVAKSLLMSAFTGGFSTERPEQFVEDVNKQHDKLNLPFTVGQYMIQLFTTIAISTTIGCAPLILPLSADFTGSYTSGWAYWFVYNGLSGGVYGWASYERLGSLMPELSKKGDLKLGLLNLKYFMAGGAGVVILSVVFILVDMVVCAITKQPSPAPCLMLYAAPVSFLTIDLLFILLVSNPSKGERMKHFFGIVAYSVLVGAPIEVVLVPIFLASISSVRSVVAVVFVVVGWPSLKRAFHQASIMVLDKVYFGRLSDIGEGPKHYFAMKNLYDLYIGMGCLLLFPFRDLSSINVLFLQCVNVFRGQRAGVLAIIHIAKKVSTTTKQDGSKEDEGYKLKRRNSEIDVPEILQKFGGEKGAAHIDVQLAIPMINLINTQITNCAPSFVYLALTTLLFWRGNRGLYYIYECMNFDDWLQATIIVAIKFTWEILNILDNMRMLNENGLLKPFLKLAVYTHDMTRMNLSLTIALTCVIFTSCFYIKYDGIFILSNIGQCNGIVDWRSNVWVNDVDIGNVGSLVAAGVYPASY